jgi:hypothetical protein
LLSARDQTLDSVCQFPWNSLPYLYIMIIYWVIIRNVSLEKSLLFQHDGIRQHLDLEREATPQHYVV